MGPPVPLHVTMNFEAGFGLSVLFPGWKPLRPLPPSPQPLPTCAFPGWEGKPPLGAWASLLGLGLGPPPQWAQLGEGEQLPGAGLGGWGLGAALSCLGNGTPRPSGVVREAWAQGAGLPLLLLPLPRRSGWTLGQEPAISRGGREQQRAVREQRSPAPAWGARLRPQSGWPLASQASHLALCH